MRWGEFKALLNGWVVQVRAFNFSNAGFSLPHFDTMVKGVNQWLPDHRLTFSKLCTISPGIYWSTNSISSIYSITRWVMQQGGVVVQRLKKASLWLKGCIKNLGRKSKTPASVFTLIRPTLGPWANNLTPLHAHTNCSPGCLPKMSVLCSTQRALVAGWSVAASEKASCVKTNTESSCKLAGCWNPWWRDQLKGKKCIEKYIVARYELLFGWRDDGTQHNRPRDSHVLCWLRLSHWIGFS